MKLKFICNILPFVVWVSLPVLSEGQNATANLLTTNSPFVIYLENPPWIKEMRYAESVFWQSGPVPGHIDKQGWGNETNRVAIQPSGLFFEVLSVPPGGPVSDWPPGTRAIRGVSDHYDWEARKNIKKVSILALSSKFPNEGASEKNIGSILSKMRKQWIERVRYFGLIPLATNSFKLLDQNQFSAKTTKGDLLAGKIVAAVDNQPLSLTYTLNGSNDDIFHINYQYPNGEELPTYFEYWETRNGNQFDVSHTNWIESAKYGTDTTISNGYSPSMFFTNLAIFTRLLIESNGQRWNIENNQKPALVDETYHPLPPNQKNKNWFMVLIAFLAVSGLVIWRVKRRG